MLAQAVVEFFKFKVVSSIFVLTCGWNLSDQVIFSRQLSRNGLSVTFTSDAGIIAQTQSHRFQGILYIRYGNDTHLEKVKPEYFSEWYKWLVVADELPECLRGVRYDADIALLNWERSGERNSPGKMLTSTKISSASIDDIYVNPKDGISLHPWAQWSVDSGFQLTHERERLLRRMNLKQTPLQISTVGGAYNPNWYKGSFRDYLLDESFPELDSSARMGYVASSTILKSINASEILEETVFYMQMQNDNRSSMVGQVISGAADISGNLRMLTKRLHLVDYIMPSWPLEMGFMYLAERQSSSSMFVQPFALEVWLCCLGLGVVLAVAQRVTARKPHEKEGAYMAVLATWLQQDAGTVPEGISSRWTFTVLSIASMIVYAYYTSAIVSALMSSGTEGPTTIGALANSKYEISSGDFDYMRQLLFEVKTNRSDMEYLKKKKKGTKFYQNLETGIDLVKNGTTAYHAEYNQMYPYMKSLSDDQLCKLSYIDTETGTSWILTAKRSKWTSIFRVKAARMMEVGIAKRILSKVKIRPPECRSNLLAEQVTFGDVSSLLLLTFVGAVLAFVVLAAEVFVDRIKTKKSEDSVKVFDYVD